MLLIDSLYINNSGGVRLLDYLITSLKERQLPFHLVADARCKGRYDSVDVEYLSASLIGRINYYNHIKKEYRSALCFGNIPPTRRIDCPVYTYYHNINYLTLKGLPSRIETYKSWLKRRVFKHFKNNTDYWIVQTSNTKEELVRHLHEDSIRVKIMPFYNIPEVLKNLKKMPHGNDYVYVANYTGSKQHEELLEAWVLLHNLGIDQTLHLTVPASQVDFGDKLKKAQNKGVKIVNHGFIPFKEVIKLYEKSKAIIYPSLNESLGLGIVEAIGSGCDVIGADLPYIHSICKPSSVFNPYSAESIANAVMEYEKGNNKKSELLIYNHIDELIDMLTNGMP